MSDLRARITLVLGQADGVYVGADTDTIAEDVLRAIFGPHDLEGWRFEYDEHGDVALHHRCDGLHYTPVYDVDDTSLLTVLAEIRGHECEDDDED